MAGFQKEQDIRPLDRFCFLGALFGILIWKTTDSLLLPVIIISLVDIVAFIPTFRKGYHKPHEETVSMWILNSVKFFLGIVALQSYSLTTWLFPLVLALVNGSFAVFLLIRRQYIKP
ncbi:MAG: hypothetical protein WCT49_00285 [Candidatus Paceibacterota bacterium]|nr:hypothetical protein [Candidatus Paceibacterota bacterium]